MTGWTSRVSAEAAGLACLVAARVMGDALAEPDLAFQQRLHSTMATAVVLWIVVRVSLRLAYGSGVLSPYRALMGATFALLLVGGTEIVASRAGDGLSILVAFATGVGWALALLPALWIASLGSAVRPSSLDASE